jgi:hypothetical protein
VELKWWQKLSVARKKNHGCFRHWRNQWKPRRHSMGIIDRGIDWRKQHNDNCMLPCFSLGQSDHDGSKMLTVSLVCSLDTAIQFLPPLRDTGYPDIFLLFSPNQRRIGTIL